LEDKPTEAVVKKEVPEPRPGCHGSPFNHSLPDFSRNVSQISSLLRAVACCLRKESKE
jgi:hypothetical protein